MAQCLSSRSTPTTKFAYGKWGFFNKQASKYLQKYNNKQSFLNGLQSSACDMLIHALEEYLKALRSSNVV